MSLTVRLAVTVPMSEPCQIVGGHPLAIMRGDPPTIALVWVEDAEQLAHALADGFDNKLLSDALTLLQDWGFANE